MWNRKEEQQGFSGKVPGKKCDLSNKNLGGKLLKRSRRKFRCVTNSQRKRRCAPENHEVRGEGYRHSKPLSYQNPK
jgi:hypothetical protein